MGGGASFALIPHSRFCVGCTVPLGLRTESGIRPRSYRGTRPRFASGTLMSLRTIPPFRAGVVGHSVFRMGARVALSPAVGACWCAPSYAPTGEPTLSGAPLSPCFAAESTREGTLMSLSEGAPARPGWGVKFGHPDVTTDDTAPLASPPRRIVG